MPPKKPGSNEPSKKNEQKKKEKIIEDKTFGLKNKKGAKQQKFVKMVHTQVTHGNKTAREIKLEAKKEDKKKLEKEELNLLFKPVMEQKVAKGTDPKSVLCAFFKAGTCKKGDRCKFSHDLTIGRKAEKRSIYDDVREDSENQDSMENWDEQKLQEVVDSKHGETNNAMPGTAIICRYFLDAVENNKYGWFWQCPNGDKCHYRHALPPGFVLKKDKKKQEEQRENAISLEDLIEKERAALSSKNLTKVTLETFLKWKERKRKEKAAKVKAESEKKKTDYKAGKAYGISGREMFEFNPDMVGEDDADAQDTSVFVRDGAYYQEDAEGEDGTSGPMREINLDALASEAREIDETGAITVPKNDKSDSSHTVANGPVSGMANASNGTACEDESNKLDMAGALPPELQPPPEGTTQAAAAENYIAVDTPIDENLFDDDDLDFVDEELETLDLDD